MSGYRCLRHYQGHWVVCAVHALALGLHRRLVRFLRRSRLPLPAPGPLPPVLPHFQNRRPLTRKGPEDRPIGRRKRIASRGLRVRRSQRLHEFRDVRGGGGSRFFSLSTLLVASGRISWSLISVRSSWIWISLALIFSQWTSGRLSWVGTSLVPELTFWLVSFSWACDKFIISGSPDSREKLRCG